MSIAGKVLLLVLLYGGPSVLALALLLAGACFARGKAAIIAIACIAGLLTLLHAVQLYFLSDMGRAWSGGPGGNDAILLSAGVALLAVGVAANVAFVLRKGAGRVQLR